MWLLLILVYIFIFIIDIPTLKNIMQKKIFFIYLLFMCINFILSYLLLTNNAPISPTIIIETIVNYFIRGEFN